MDQRPTQFDLFESDEARRIKIQVADLRDNPEKLEALHKRVREALQKAREANRRTREAMRPTKEFMDRRFQASRVA